MCARSLETIYESLQTAVPDAGTSNSDLVTRLQSVNDELSGVFRTYGTESYERPSQSMLRNRVLKRCTSRHSPQSGTHCPNMRTLSDTSCSHGNMIQTQPRKPRS